MRYRLPGCTQRHWAIAGLILGVLQMAGAAFLVALLVKSGVNSWSLAAVIVTGVLTTISDLLFGKGSLMGKRKQEGEESRDKA